MGSAGEYSAHQALRALIGSLPTDLSTDSVRKLRALNNSRPRAAVTGYSPPPAFVLAADIQPAGAAVRGNLPPRGEAAHGFIPNRACMEIELFTAAQRVTAPFGCDVSA
jgi:hypothetical protein